MSEKEKFSLAKMVRGVFDAKNLGKGTIFSLTNPFTIAGLIFLLVIGGKVVIGWITPDQPNQTQTSSIQIEKGANIQNLTTSQQQQDQDERTYGVEFQTSSVDVEATFVKYVNERVIVGVGGRYNFEDESGYPVIKLRWDFH